MTEREPMSNEERLRKALEEIKFLHDHHVIHLDGCSFANGMGHIALNVLASTEPEQPASEGEDCPHERFITITHAGGQEKQCSECGVLVEPSITEGEQERRIYRNESTEVGRRVWAAVDRAAKRAPRKVLERLLSKYTHETDDGQEWCGACGSGKPLPSHDEDCPFALLAQPQERGDSYDMFLAGYLSGQDHGARLAFEGKGKWDPREAFREKFPEPAGGEDE